MYIIPIVYRSRLEANVAQFLNDAGVEFRYEERSFLLSSGHYCPDFWLPQQDAFIECRGYKNNESERKLLQFGQLCSTRKPQSPFWILRFDSAHHTDKEGGCLFAVCSCGLPLFQQECPKCEGGPPAKLFLLEMKAGVPLLVQGRLDGKDRLPDGRVLFVPLKDAA